MYLRKQTTLEAADYCVGLKRECSSQAGSKKKEKGRKKKVRKQGQRKRMKELKKEINRINKIEKKEIIFYQQFDDVG